MNKPPCPATPPEKIRLSKLMAAQGLCSRREADAFIEKGWVLVDNQRIFTLGTKVSPNQKITLAPEASRSLKQAVTILLNKPIGYVSSQPEDNYPPAIQLITPENHFSGDRAPFPFRSQHLQHLATAGRLDIDSQGLLVLTQNGQIARQLVGQEIRIEKEYWVRVSGRILPQTLARLSHGLVLDQKPLADAQVSSLGENLLKIVLREGRKRQIRRMCELVGLKVIGLKRVRIGRIKLGNLPLGQWRYLSPEEKF